MLVPDEQSIVRMVETFAAGAAALQQVVYLVREGAIQATYFPAAGRIVGAARLHFKAGHKCETLSADALAPPVTVGVLRARARQLRQPRRRHRTSVSAAAAAATTHTHSRARRPTTWRRNACAC